MKINIKKISSFFILFLIIFIIYFVFIPIKLYKKEIYKIEKYFEIKDNIILENNPDSFFYTENEIGYFSFDNKITSYKNINEPNINITANNLFFITYEKVNNEIKIYSNKHELINTIHPFGYPYINWELPVFFVIKTNGMGLSLYSIEGNIIFKDVDFTSLITSISINKNLISLISTIDGKTYLINKDGKIITIIENTNSKIKIAKSNAIDNNSDKIAVCSGLNPEIIEIYNIENHKLIKSIKTNTNLRYTSFLSFAFNRIFYETNEGINSYDLKNKKIKKIKFKGIIQDIKFGKHDKIFVSSKSADINHLYILTKNGKILYYREFKDNKTSICHVDDKFFYFRLDNYIIKFSLGAQS